jgi:hypothetical protein
MKLLFSTEIPLADPFRIHLPFIPENDFEPLIGANRR